MRFLLLALTATTLLAADGVVASPDGTIAISVADAGGLAWSVTMDGKPLLVPSRLRLAFRDGTVLGPKSAITQQIPGRHDGTWTQPFGKRRTVREHWQENRLTLTEPDGRTWRLVVRAFDDGVALRYDLPESSRLGTFEVTDERTEFRFAADHPCWSGTPNSCAENPYPRTTLSQSPVKSVLPTVVQTPVGFAAIAESDLLDWAGMFLAPTEDGPGLRSKLASLPGGQGMVRGTVPMVSPWRVMMLARQAKDLVANDLVDTLATPSRVEDTSWIKPGITAWDTWWASSVNSRGTTASHKPYIDLASTMGWPYMLVDWGWNTNGDVTTWNPKVDIPELLAYAKARNVKLLLWMHSKDLNTTGREKAFATVASWGVPGVKVDFMNSDSQNMVQWYVETLTAAAKHHLMVDFHGAYKPTGLARTFPNYVTQEGVLGNEYYKLKGNLINPTHHVTLPFTRGLLGPMDFTPGGFQNRTKATWTMDAGAKSGGNCQVLGSRAHQLALTMIYLSPLTCLADSPRSYLGEGLKTPAAGLEFYRDLPTVWDDTVVLQGEMAEFLVLARRSGTRWYLAALGGEAGRTLSIPLAFLGTGAWSLRSWSDAPDTATEPTHVVEGRQPATAATTISVTLADGGGGYVGILTPSP